MSNGLLIGMYNESALFEENKNSFYLNVETVPEKQNKINLWSSRGLYGKVDHLGNVVVPKTNKMKTILKTGGVVFTFPFVYDLLSDCFYYYNSEAENHSWPQIDIGNVSAKNRDIFYYYHSYLDAKKNNFLNKHLKKLYFRFLSLEDMMLLFLEEEGFLTFEKFVLSSLNPMHTTGLVFNVFEYSYNNNKIKEQKFLNENWFLFFVESARRFGVCVDENVPWRVVVDINSYAFSYYLQRRVELEEIKKNKSDLQLTNFLEKFDTSEVDYMKKVAKIDIGKFFDEYFDNADVHKKNEVVLFFTNLYKNVKNCNVQPDDIWEIFVSWRKENV